MVSDSMLQYWGLEKWVVVTDIFCQIVTIMAEDAVMNIMLAVLMRLWIPTSEYCLLFYMVSLLFVICGKHWDNAAVTFLITSTRLSLAVDVCIASKITGCVFLTVTFLWPTEFFLWPLGLLHFIDFSASWQTFWKYLNQITSNHKWCSSSEYFLLDFAKTIKITLAEMLPALWFVVGIAFLLELTKNVYGWNFFAILSD